MVPTPWAAPSHCPTLGLSDEQPRYRLMDQGDAIWVVIDRRLGVWLDRRSPVPAHTSGSYGKHYLLCFRIKLSLTSFGEIGR